MTEKPIVIVPCVPTMCDKIRFFAPEKIIEVEKDITLVGFLNKCDGYHTIPMMAEETGLKEEDLTELAEILESYQIIADSREQFVSFHRVSSFPANFSYNRTKLDILEHEKYIFKPSFPQSKIYQNSDIRIENLRGNSCRSFSSGELLDARTILELCANAYSKDNLPSAGNIYPLRLFVVLPHGDATGKLRSGYYEFIPGDKPSLAVSKKKFDQEQMNYCFNNTMSPFGSTMQIVIAADVSKQSWKYANRAYRFSLLEAGHLAQNINYYAFWHRIGVCELGGFLDEPLKKELSMKDETLPLLAMALGVPSNKDVKLPLQIEDELPSCVKETMIFPTDSFFIANAFSADDNSCGISTSSTEAEFKACMEMIEREYAGKFKADKICKKSELDGLAVSESVIMPAEKNSSSGKLAWKTGYINDDPDDKVYVPMDFVYYGIKGYPKDFPERFYFGNSSGVAAHTDEQEAEARAILELIERDAIMKTWFSQKQPPIISKKDLSLHINKRVSELRTQGRKVYFHLLPSKYGTVIQAEIVGRTYPCFTVGAAADLSFKREGVIRAAKKALEEAEAKLYFANYNPKQAPISEDEVITPDDHAIYYSYPKNCQKISWLWKNNRNKAIIPEKAKQFTLGGLKKTLKIVIVDIDCDETICDKKIYIKRVISPELVPMEFGFDGYYYYSHKAVKDFDPACKIYPHYFS